jgi:hypothetical protein
MTDVLWCTNADGTVSLFAEKILPGEIVARFRAIVDPERISVRDLVFVTRTDLEFSTGRCAIFEQDDDSVWIEFEDGNADLRRRILAALDSAPGFANAMIDGGT